MGACADVCKPVTDILRQYIPEFTKNVQIDAYTSHSHRNKCHCKDLSHQLAFWDSEGIRFNNKMIVCCYVHNMLKYSLKSAAKH